MPARWSTECHSLFSRLGDFVSVMRRHYAFFTCLGAALGLVLALPRDPQEPLLVGAEVDRVMDGIRRQTGGPPSTPVDYTRCSDNPEEDMTTLEMIRKEGYPAEEHFVTTRDGYILALHRIPGREGSPAVLLHHALLESSFCWVITGKDKGLGFLLADRGYDVWMANIRGNTYSKNHTYLSTSYSQFWDFSWHEMGIYDLPAEIEYITKMKNDSLTYIGHSMGTTMFFVMANERPDIASKVKAMYALAPVAFTQNIVGPFKWMGSLLNNVQYSVDFPGTTEFFAQNALFKFSAKCICSRPLLRDICRTIVFSVVGFNVDKFNTTLLPLILTHTPAGTSLKTILHFAQGIRSQQFLRYDYGPKMNLRIYDNEAPPAYNFSNIQVPITLFWGRNDFLAQPKDVKRLYQTLLKDVEMYEIEDPNFNHLDFLWGKEAPKLVYAKVLDLMERHRRSNEAAA